MTDGDQMSRFMGQSGTGSFQEADGLSVRLSSSRQTQWDPPTWDSPGDDASLEHEAEMDLGTPTYDENPMKVRAGVSEGELGINGTGAVVEVAMDLGGDRETEVT